jgi:hypothetical protein
VPESQNSVPDSMSRNCGLVRGFGTPDERSQARWPGQHASDCGSGPRVSHSCAAVPFAGQRIDDGLRDRMCGGGTAFRGCHVIGPF